MNGWTSPRLGIRFDLSESVLKIYRPDSQPFLTFNEVSQRAQERDQIAQERDQVAQERDQDAQEREQAVQDASVREGTIGNDSRLNSGRSESSRSPDIGWAGSLLPDSQVLEQVEPALAGADEVEVAVAVDVDGGHLQARCRRCRRGSP